MYWSATGDWLMVNVVGDVMTGLESLSSSQAVNKARTLTSIIANENIFFIIVVSIRFF
jgi:hypothetical protein